MNQTLTDQKNLLTALAEVYKHLSAANDEVHARKIRQLIQKVRQEEKLIAFCGHFSAGKSSMINALLGEELLPSSPVPTSANIVKVKKGEEYAKVYFYQGKPVLYPAPYNYDLVKSYCKDGDAIHSIEISTARFPLEGNAAVMDTPGIDSADDAHRISTEDAIHLADIIFYVMDYNHVQSEVNFLFTKELFSSGRRLFLVVNQIDKHDDSELSFEEFTESVKDGFLNWGVKPERIFYTSLKKKDSAHNEFSSLKKLIRDFSQEKPESGLLEARAAAKQIILDHVEWLKGQYQEENEENTKLLEQQEEKRPDEVLQSIERLKNERKEADQSISRILEDFKTKAETILKNAYLMPADTRELARQYLESTKSDFKVGLLFSRGKTEAEKKLRFQKLKEDLQEKMKNQLEWHIKELAIVTLKENRLADSRLENLAESILLNWDDSIMTDSVKSQVSITGEYVLSYTSTVAEALRRDARHAAKEFGDVLAESLRIEQSKRIGKLDEEITKLEKLEHAIQSVRETSEKTAKKQGLLEDLLFGRGSEADSGTIGDLFRRWDGEENDFKVVLTDDFEWSQNEKQEKQQETEYKVEINELEASPIKETVLEKARKLAAAAQLLKDQKGFRYLAEEMKNSSVRLESQTFTVALFGAFSAGKSSFANAVLGSRVLPVSPNPTTAAINKICPPSGLNPHGTARVKLKTNEMILEDVLAALGHFGLSASSLDEALERVSGLLKQPAEGGQQSTQGSFLSAFYEGYPAFKHRMGEELIVDLNEFREFAANEAKSCLVDVIELYYDCELTRKGVILVDTPGADSINARHTGTAFEYIKNSDAVIFVTYYNHPFSKADREFLIQLGRVKDSFSMDKMFFMVNAVDLASSEEELTQVMEYIRGQLGNFQIRYPRLYPISSKAALQEKTGEVPLAGHFLQDSGISLFEKEFNHFLEHDLKGLVLSAAERLLIRAEKLLAEVLAAADTDEETKKLQSAALKEELKKIQELVKNSEAKIAAERLYKEIKELAFYSKQRVFLRFNDFFKEAFNPAVLKDDGRDLKKAVELALNELKQSLGFDLAQEMRATSLRSENYLNKLLSEEYNGWLHRAKEIRAELEITPIQSYSFPVPQISQPMQELESQDFRKELSLFKNPKSFFEKNEKVKMNAALQKAFDTPADQYIADQAEGLNDYYREKYLTAYQEIKNAFIGGMEEIYDGYLSAYEGENQLQTMEELLQKFLEIRKA